MRKSFRRPEGPLLGSMTLPPDKSMSHRAVLMAAMADGTSRLGCILDSADVRSTIDGVAALGAGVRSARLDGALELEITGWGRRGPESPAGAIDCGNSGTTARLLAGVVAGWDVEVTLTGDASLSTRPMGRIAEPLGAMGARFDLSEGGTLPMTVHGGGLRGSLHRLRIASAQVKTALLLAGTRAEGRTEVEEPMPSRDHTERMLPAFGVPVGRDERSHRCWVDGPVVPAATDMRVPGDPSSAAFLIAAALLVPDSRVRLDGLLLNPTRVGFLAVLERMGAGVQIVPRGLQATEAVGSVEAWYLSESLVSAQVQAREIPQMVDEIPVLALVAAAAHGTTRFDGLAELRVKESDRLQSVAEGLAFLGADVDVGEDWLEVTGPTELGGGTLDSLGDHRLAMTYAVAGLASSGEVQVERFEAVDVSYPRFAADLEALTQPAARG